MSAAIRTSSLCKSYGRGESAVHALREVSLEIAAGERVALLGKSGSGKSTLLNLLGGLDHPSTGGILVGDQQLHSFSKRQLAGYRSRHVGMIFQSFNLIAARTALENVELPMIFAGVSPGQRKERAAQALSAVGLKDRCNHRPSQLSGGECQRVAVARALVNAPKILLADEPTGNLDSQTAEEVMSLILRDMNDRGTTLLLVTHDEELAQSCTSRLVRLQDGRLAD